MHPERKPQGDATGITPGTARASTCLDLSLRIGNEETADGIRRALREGIANLASANPGLRPLICAIDLSPDETPIIVWHTPDQSDLPSTHELTIWFARAAANGGEFERLEGRARWGLLLPHSDDAACCRFTGLFVYGSEPDEEARAFLMAMTRISSYALRKIDRITTERTAHRRQAEAHNETLVWMESSADILWDATPDGLIRCRRILNQRTDVALSIDRRNLRQFSVGAENRNLYELLNNGVQIRHQPVQFLDDFENLGNGTNQLIISVTPKFSDSRSLLSFAGTFTCVPRIELQQSTNPALAGSTGLREKREREERHRMDDDTMLEGLRLLLDNRSPRENLIRLIQLICGNLGGKQPILVESGFDGRPRIILPEHKHLNYAAGSVLDDLATSVAEGRLALFDENTKEFQHICDAFGLEGDTVVVFSLPLRGQLAYLICTTDMKAQLRAEAISFVERFAFILRQALILRAEQAQMAQTAKMAALGQMSASIAHELKQPLNTISLATQNLESLLMMPNVDPEAVETKLNRVMSQVERASNIIDRMRRFGRKSLGEQNPVVIHDLIEGVLLMMGHALDRQNIEIELDLTPDLVITGDELQLEQVLMNVIQNSMDAIAGIGTQSEQPMPTRAGKIRFRSHVSDEDAGINILRVEDNGPGFSSVANEHAAEAFFTTKPAEHGTGLGLAICDAIIRECGGRLTYGNYEDGGYVSFAMPSGKLPYPESR